MQIIDEGIISLRSERNAYMPGIELLPDGSFIAGQFTASYFTASDAKNRDTALHGRALDLDE